MALQREQFVSGDRIPDLVQLTSQKYEAGTHLACPVVAARDELVARLVERAVSQGQDVRP